MKSEMQKLLMSFVAALAFVLVSMPYTYKLTDQLASSLSLNLASRSGCPTIVGLGVHGTVFFAVMRLMMLLPVPACMQGLDDYVDYDDKDE